MSFFFPSKSCISHCYCCASFFIRHARPISYIIIVIHFDSVFVVEMGGVSSKITQATRFDTNELFTDLLILVMSIIRFLLERKKKNVLYLFSCHFNSIRTLRSVEDDNRFFDDEDLDCPKRRDRRHTDQQLSQLAEERERNRYSFPLSISFSPLTLTSSMIIFEL